MSDELAGGRGAPARSAVLASADTLDLIRDVADGLAAAGVSYCHWKSNEAIGRSARGENDLDLLVARGHGPAFCSVLYGLGFRAARQPVDRQVPGIVDYYGLDAGTGRTVHVHAHHQLVLGDDMTKNFRLPIEGPYLSATTRAAVLPLPSAEFEYVVFVLRMVVKHSPWDAQLNRKGRLTPSERRELAYLEDRIRPGDVDRVVRTHLPYVGTELFAAASDVAAERAGRLTRVLIARRVLAALRAHGRRPLLVDLWLRMWRRQRRKFEARLGTRPSGKRLETGGALVAVTGSDGAGKSSAIEFLVGELSRAFEVESFHMGKPPWSRMSRFVKRPMRRLRTYGLFDATRLPAWNELSRYPGFGFVVWHALTARDRYLQYRRASQAAARGVVVLCDRFPTPQISLMDGPRTARLIGLERRPLARWMTTVEQRYYERLARPDLLVVLRVSPDVAVGRRIEADADTVRRRAASVFEADWTGTDAVVIDADRPQDEVHAELLRLVWNSL